jgi:hypothetical protein
VCDNVGHRLAAGPASGFKSRVAAEGGRSRGWCPGRSYEFPKCHHFGKHFPDMHLKFFVSILFDDMNTKFFMLMVFDDMNTMALGHSTVVTIICVVRLN